MIGLNLGMPPAYDSLLGIGGLAIMLLFLTVSGDWRLLLARVRGNLWMIIPLSTALGLSLLVSVDLPVPLIQYAFSRRALSLITFGHAFLGLILAVSFFRGLNTFRTRASA